MRTFTYRLVAFTAVLACVAVARVYAEDVYVIKNLSELKFPEGAPQDRIESALYDVRDDAPFPYAVLDGEGEAYIGGAVLWRGAYTRKIGFHVPERRKITGCLFIPNPDVMRKQKMLRLQFEIAADDVPSAKDESERRTQFLEFKLAHYQRLVMAELPGAAWFRHQAMATQRALGRPNYEARAREDRFGQVRVDSPLRAFSLATGGQALAENLQLDRVLPRSGVALESIPLDSITGVTIRSFDWTQYVDGKKPKLDALAAMIPADQHAVFFPTFDALMALADHADRFGTPIFRAAEPRSDDASVRRRYERQLCLPSSAISRLVGPRLIESVALTGGDPYLLMGSDVAVMFEAKDRTALAVLINARVSLAAKEYPAAKPVEGKIGDVTYRGARSPDRVICSYVATIGDAVVVTNSLAQLKRLVDVQTQKTPSLATLPEYTFFRDRYPLGDANESGLLILSDDTIRRWCGPKWRIADARRVRAAAVMSDMQARYMDRFAAKDQQTLAARPDYALPDAGEFEIAPGGVQSSVYGNLGFMTPIGELDIQRVTIDESRLYYAWRQGYQANWSRYFDPIAVRFLVSKEKLSLDTTVMPLINATEYAEIIDLSRGGKLSATSGDPHPEAALHWTMALDPKSSAFRRNVDLMRAFSGNDKFAALDWLGPSVSIYADRDPVWDEWAKHYDGPLSSLNYAHRLPVALRVEVRDGLKLALFLTALRGYIESTAPELTSWEIKEHAGVQYVRIGMENTVINSLYYTANEEAFTITPREDVLHKAIERKLARDKVNREKVKKEQGDAAAASKQADDEPDAAATPAVAARPWLGDHWCLRVDRSALAIVDTLFAEPQQQQMQRLAWANLPILNEWRRMYPQEDALTLHERVWHRRLICPGGGDYRWNEEWQTYESTVYGHSGEPIAGPTLAAGLRDIRSADFGLTFEPDGLRARVEVLRDRGKD